MGRVAIGVRAFAVIAKLRRTSGADSSIFDMFRVVLARFGTRSAQAVVFLILARSLSPSQLGAYGIVTSSIYLAGQLGHLGIRQSIASMIGRGELAAGKALPIILTVWAPLSAGTAFVVWLGARGGLPAFGQHGMAWVVAASSSLLLIALLQGVLLGRGKLGWYGLSDTLPSIVLAALLASVILLGRPLEALALPLYAVSFALAALIVLPAALSNIGIIEIDWSFLGRLVVSGAPFAFSMFFIFLCGRTSLFALERLADHSAVGRFFAAQRFTEISLEVATAASLVLFSKGVRSAGGKEAVQQGVAQASVLFWIFAAISVPMVVFTPLVLPMLLGREYEAAAPIAQVLSLGLAFAATTRTLNGVVSAAGRAWYAGGVAMGGVLLNVLISFLIIPRMGAVGAAIAMVVAQVAMCVAYGVVLRNAFEIKMLNFIIPKFRA